MKLGTNYYIVDIADTEKTGRLRRFDSLEEARACAEGEIVRPEVQGPIYLDLIHYRTDKAEKVACLTKANPTVS